jgi:hypothetical protein
MRPFEQTWDDLEAYVEKVFFATLTDDILGYADTLSLKIEREIRKQLKSFFLDLSNMFGDWVQSEPEWVREISGPWQEFSLSYFKFKNPASRSRKDQRMDFFVYSELPRIVRNSRKSRLQRRAKVKTARELARSPSLRMMIRNLGDPAQYWGDVSVTIESHTKINRGGRRQYKAGTSRDGQNLGGKTIKFSTDYVTISVEWLPALNGLDVLERGVTETPSKGYAALPRSVQTKLLNKEYRDSDHAPAYRPLLGPYMLWYQDTTIRQIMKKATAAYGPQI